MIVGKVGAPKPPKMIFVQRNNVVDQFSTHAADPTFRRFILPRAPSAGAQRRELTGSQELEDVISELGIMVEQHVSIRAGKRECFPQLLHNPIACWMEGNVEMQNAPAMVFNREEVI
jgi:hypothetical protein